MLPSFFPWAAFRMLQNYRFYVCLQFLFLFFSIRGMLALSIHHYSIALIAESADAPHNIGARSTETVSQDGSGSNYSAIAVLWIVFSFAAGILLLLVGLVRKAWSSKLVNASGLGLALAVCTWTTIINSAPEKGVADTAVFCSVMASMAAGAVVGYLTRVHDIGMLFSALAGGLTIGLRLAIIKSHLLVALFAIDWVIIAITTLASAALFLYRKSISEIFGATLSGTFLVALAVDLVINKQSGISSGLWYLLDHNRSRVADILNKGYVAPLSTTIIIIISLCISPIIVILSFRKSITSSCLESSSCEEALAAENMPKSVPTIDAREPSLPLPLFTRISHHTDSTEMPLSPVLASRFSWDSR